MNDLARDLLRKAALDNVRQIYGAYQDDRGGYCAMGILMKSMLCSGTTLQERFDLGRFTSCPFGDTKILSEGKLIVHLNDVHKLDFIGIAEKV